MGALHLCISPKETGENIRNLIRASRYSISDIQGFLGFSSPRAIYKWTEGKSVPSIDSLLILSRVLGTGIDDILVVKEDTRTMKKDGIKHLTQFVLLCLPYFLRTVRITS